ncbi:chromate resistance protein ChrB domain-containing protein [Nocardioides panzhihuensis]|uniref:ChrB C-terminal domain-containing protein n=1 Tax=Nocardioides panzhihuensis TaxID=860243 RepID=A0A7Z0DT00_9ACTN|nr:chromate resistance protein ChrB domain-containing protein [Nocardioides panzhihuensis]NYI81224.1 hypothetical protein [Nocardioides panzhihuensis]
MKWITRERPKTDRIACPWLIRRFIDPEAEIIYVPAADVLATAQEIGAISFDAPGATYTHQPNPAGGEWCTFETLIDAYGLTDPALTTMAHIVHAADVSTDVDTHPFGAALAALGAAGPFVEADDQVLLGRASYIYDALYTHCGQRLRAETES